MPLSLAHSSGLPCRAGANFRRIAEELADEHDLINVAPNAG